VVDEETRALIYRTYEVWCDGYQRKAVTTFARAIEDAPVPKQQKSDALEYACQAAVERRAPFLAHVAKVLDKVIATGPRLGRRECRDRSHQSELLLGSVKALRSRERRVIFKSARPGARRH
jgi:hypothetical protein